MKFFILCLVTTLLNALAVQSFPAASKNVPAECVDPTFACQDLKSARSCGVVKACIHDIWSTMSAPADNDEICDICKEMVKEARDQLLSNMTQEELKEVFEGSCKLLPVKLIADACIKLVDEFIPELVEMLASRMDPTMVCTVSGLCNLAHQSVENAPKETRPVHDELVCEFCTHVLQHVKDLITANTTVEEFRTALQNFCKHTGSFSSKCTEFVNDYFDKIFGFIQSMDPKGFCTLISLCTGGQHSNHVIAATLISPATKVQKAVPLTKLIPAQRIDQSNDALLTNEIQESYPEQLPLERMSHPLLIFNQQAECALCGPISFYLMTDLGGERGEENVNKAIKQVCSRWVSEYPVHCSNFVSKYSDHLRKHIVKGGEYNDLCPSIEACNTDSDDNEKPQKPKVESVECDICKDFVQQLQNRLKDPDVKQSLEDLLDRTCSVLPTELANECKTFVQQNIDALINLLVQDIDPSVICSALKLCDKTVKVLPPKINDMECDLCKEVVQKLDDELKDQRTVEQIREALDKVCGYLPSSLSAKCEKFVDTYSDMLITLLIQEMDPSMICAALKMCPETVKVLPPKINDLECDLCKEVVQKLDDQLKDQRTEEEIREALDKVCGYLPSSMSAKCENFVNTYSSMLITLLIQEMDPGMICAALKICPETVKVLPPKINDMECDLCKEVVQKLDDELKDQRTEEQIREALDKVCGYLPSSMSAKCEKFVDTYSDMLITLLIQEMDPSMICAALKMCPATVKVLPSKINDLECDLCKEVVQKLDDELKDQRTEEEIRKALGEVCSILPTSLSERCGVFVDRYSSMLITLLAQEMDPSLICAALKMCPVKNLECESCQYLFHYIQNQLMDGQTQEGIKEDLKKVCKLLPSNFSDNCIAYIDEFGSSLLAIVAQYLDPSTVCYSLHACGNTSFSSQIEKSKLPNLDECSLCTTVVDYLDKLLEEDDVDKEITQLMEKVCGALPSSVKDKCSVLIETYGPYMLQMIGQLADSQQVCQAIDICPRSPGHVHLLGGSKCTFGPSYWCKSKAHAISCKAEEYCSKKEWKN